MRVTGTFTNIWIYVIKRHVAILNFIPIVIVYKDFWKSLETRWMIVQMENATNREEEEKNDQIDQSPQYITNQ